MSDGSSASSARNSSGDRLAVLGSQGVEIWSRAHGVRSVGPPTTDTSGISQLTWSADGRYLAWYQAIGMDGGGEIVSVDTVDGLTAHTWPQKFSPTALTVSGTSVYTLNDNDGGSFLVRTGPDGANSSYALPAAPALAAPTTDGFIFASGTPSDSPATYRLWSLDLKGHAEQLATLPAPRHPNLAVYHQLAASSSTATLEEANHDDVCGLGGTALLHAVDLRSGTQQLPALPGGPQAKWRLLALHFDAGGKGLVFGAYDAQRCGSAEASSDSTIRMPTALFELPATGGPVRRLASNAFAGQRGPGGQLAEITGTEAMDYANEDPAATQVGQVRVLVDGKPVPAPGTPYDILWAPPSTH